MPSLQHWIKAYNAKAPEPYVSEDKYQLYFNPEKGFCEIGFGESMLIVNHLCGDGRYWKDRIDRLATSLGLHHCGTWCVRKEVKAYIRLFGYKIVRDEILSDGKHRYYCKDKNGNEGLVSPAFVYENGVQAYFVTWEI